MVRLQRRGLSPAYSGARAVVAVAATATGTIPCAASRHYGMLPKAAVGKESGNLQVEPSQANPKGEAQQSI